MAVVTTNIFTLDTGSDAIEGVEVLVVSGADGSQFRQTTNVLGKAVFSLEEGLYAVSATKTKFSSPPETTIDVAVAPVPTAATYRPPAKANPSLIAAGKDTVSLIIDESVNGDTPVDVDISAATTVADIVTTINADLNTAYGASYNAVATEVIGEVRLTSPTTGALSTVEIVNDGGLPVDSAVDAVWGEVINIADILLTGTDTPLDYNDFDLELVAFDIPFSTDPTRCTLYADFVERVVSVPLDKATLMVTTSPLEAIASSAGVLSGNTFYVPVVDGFASFELMRRAAVRVTLMWTDAVYRFDVPDVASVDFMTLIVPFFESIRIDSEAAVSLDISSELQFGVVGLKSDGSAETSPDQSFITFISSDAGVAAFEVGLLKSVAPGTTLVTATMFNALGQLLTTDPITVTVV